MTEDYVISKKGILIALLDYALAVAAFWDGLDVGLRILAGIGVIISTWYLIQKYKSEKRLNEQRLKKEEFETQIKEQELANLLLKRRNGQ